MRTQPMPPKTFANAPRHRSLRALGLDSTQAWVVLGLMTLTVVLAAGIIFVGRHHMRQLSDAYYQTTLDKLDTINDLMRNELTHWRKERLSDATSLFGTREAMQALLDTLRSPDDTKAWDDMRKKLRFFSTTYGEYDAIMLLDASGRPVLADTPTPPPFSAALRRALAAGNVETRAWFVNYYRDENDRKVYCAVVLNLFAYAGSAGPLGHVVMRIDLDTFVYPLLNAWPFPSRTGGTMILHREGDVVRVLSNTRDSGAMREDSTLSADDLDYVAARAAHGQHGIVRGLDIEGVPVVAAISSLPDNSWALVSQLTASEIESDMDKQVRTIGILIAALAASVVAGALSIWIIHRAMLARNALEAENKLNRSMTQFGTLIETMTQGLLKVNAEGIITYTNTYFLTMLGREREEVSGHDVALHLSDKALRPQLCAAGNGQEAAGDFEVVWLDKGGGKIFSVVTPVQQPDTDSAHGEKWLLVLNTTKRRHLESQLLHSQKLEAIGQLAAGIAHEINTPAQYVGNNTKFIKGAFEDMLTVIEVAGALVDSAKSACPGMKDIEALERVMLERDVEYLTSEVPNAIAQTLEGVERISTIVRSVKQFAHPGEAIMAPSDLNESMKSTATVSRNEWKYVAELDLDLDPALPLVLCMIGEINQVVLNLIINAAHAIADAKKIQPEREGRITLATRHTPPWAEIRISDTGMGIPPPVQAKIFDPFFTTKEVGRGTGQGLTISRSIVVEKHKGQLFFETRQGEGTTFVVRLPLEQADS